MADGQNTSEALPVRRVALLVEYDGGHFHGLQRQRHTPETIQGHIERVAAQVGTRSPGFIAAGRTDAGVHALGQVVAISLPQRLVLSRIAHAFNSLLPTDIRVRAVAEAPPDFSPRMDARMRTYVYRLCARDQVPPILRGFVAFSPQRLSEKRTIAAVESFPGKWEFREWRSSICQAKRTFLTLTEARAIPPGGGDGVADEPRPYWRFVFRARSFLHNQVRFMMGAVTAVGAGRLTLEELQQAIAEGHRPLSVRCEDPCGLCLTHVEYPPGRDPFAEDRKEADIPDDV